MAGAAASSGRPRGRPLVGRHAAALRRPRRAARARRLSVRADLRAQRRVARPRRRGQARRSGRPDRVAADHAGPARRRPPAGGAPAPRCVRGAHRRGLDGDPLLSRRAPAEPSRRQPRPRRRLPGVHGADPPAVGHRSVGRPAGPRRDPGADRRQPVRGTGWDRRRGTSRRDGGTRPRPRPRPRPGRLTRRARRPAQGHATHDPQPPRPRRRHSCAASPSGSSACASPGRR